MLGSAGHGFDPHPVIAPSASVSPARAAPGSTGTWPCSGQPRRGPAPGSGMLALVGGVGPPPVRNGGGSVTGCYSVMARMRTAISAAVGSGEIDWRAISLAMSPSTLIFPDMNAWMAAWGLPSTKMARATP